MNAWTWALVVACALILMSVAVSCAARVRRLDRLHARVDAARSGLESALERRAAVAAAVAVVVQGAQESPGRAQGTGARGSATGANGARRIGVSGAAAHGEDPRTGDALAAAVAATRSAGADRDAGEGAENALGRRLAAVDRSLLPPALRAELGAAEQVLSLARRVHNDAVRDTLVLRSRRLVRWLHLYGTAPMPAYFEIADAEPDVTTTASAAAGDGPMASQH